MRGVLIRMALVLAVVFASIHAPAVAHGNPPSGMAAIFHHDDDHVVLSEADHENHVHGNMAPETGHHHHCPLGLSLGQSDVQSPRTCARDIFLPDTLTELPSRALSPPLDPPIA